MKRILQISVLFLSNLAISQSSILTNGGFEDVNPGYPYNGNQTNDHHVGYTENYWAQVVGWTYPLKKIGCPFGIPSADLITDSEAHSGQRYGYCAAGEYLLNSISTHMIDDHYYYIEYYVKTGTSADGNSFGVRFYTDRPKICFTGNQELDPWGAPHLKVINITPGVWELNRFIYKATQNWEWLALGDFTDNIDDREISSWDDIKIIDLGTSPCPYEWIFENTFFDNEDFIFQSANFIFAGNDYDGIDPIGPVVVKGDSKITFKAGERVILEDGFSTDPGAYFLAEILPCEAAACPEPPTLPSHHFICGSEPIHIGSLSADGLFYEWTPADYLNDPHDPNPLFTPPAGVGQITYSVTITSICPFVTSFNSSLTQDVTVIWDEDPDPVPLINLTSIAMDDYKFSFTANYSNNTEQICTNFIESGTGTVIGPFCIDRFDDFDCCSVDITFDDLPLLIKAQLSACHDYIVEVSAKNFCFETTTTTTFNWDRNNVLTFDPMPNIITVPNPEGDGNNDSFKITTTGSDSYKIFVYSTIDPIGPVFIGSGSIYESPQEIWDGHCHPVAGTICTGSNLTNGTYSVIVHVWNDCNELDVLTQTGFLVLNYDDRMELVTSSPYATTNSEQAILQNGEKFESTLFQVFPNPTAGMVEFTLSEPIKYIAVLNMTGAIVMNLSGFGKIGKQQINLSSLSKGIYMLKVETEQGVSVSNRIVLH